jgi:hypothetical protein
MTKSMLSSGERLVQVPRSGLLVPPMALGTMGFGTSVPVDVAHQLLDRALDVGARFWDTANNYAFWAPGGTGGESETCLGAFLASRGPAVRDGVVLASKVGAQPASPGGAWRTPSGSAPRPSRRRWKAACGGSGCRPSTWSTPHRRHRSRPGRYRRSPARAGGARSDPSDRWQQLVRVAVVGGLRRRRERPALRRAAEPVQLPEPATGGEPRAARPARRGAPAGVHGP